MRVNFPASFLRATVFSAMTLGCGASDRTVRFDPPRADEMPVDSPCGDYVGNADRILMNPNYLDGTKLFMFYFSSSDLLRARNNDPILNERIDRVNRHATRLIWTTKKPNSMETFFLVSSTASLLFSLYTFKVSKDQGKKSGMRLSLASISFSVALFLMMGTCIHMQAYPGLTIEDCRLPSEE